MLHLDDQGESPGELMRVSYAAADALPSERWEYMRRVSDKNGAFVKPAVDDLMSEPERPTAEDLDAVSGILHWFVELAVSFVVSLSLGMDFILFSVGILLYA